MSGSSQSTSTPPPAGFSCPQKGAFYACADSAVRFVGCCASDPCANGGVCADGDLATATFSADRYADIPPQNCSDTGGGAGAGDGDDAAADWYTCKFTSPPFLGCCVSNPCAAAAPGGCPRADLRAARLADDEFLAGPFLGSSSSSSSSPSRTSTSAVSTNVATASSTASASSRPSGAETTSSSSSSSSFSVGAAAGVAVGGCALLAVIGVLAWRLLRQRRRARTAAAVQGDQMTTVARGPGIPPAQPSPPYSPYKESFASSPTVMGYSPSSPPTTTWSPQSPSEGWASPGPGNAAGMRPVSELAGSEIGYNDRSVRGSSGR